MKTMLKAALDIAIRLEAAGFDVILDDRDERPGSEVQGRRSGGYPL